MKLASRVRPLASWVRRLASCAWPPRVSKRAKKAKIIFMSMLISCSVILIRTQILAGRGDLRSTISWVHRYVAPWRKAGIALADTGRTALQAEVIIAHGGDIPQIETRRHRHGAVDELRVIGAENGSRRCI